MVNLTLLRTLLVTSCLLALSQACKKKQVTLLITIIAVRRGFELFLFEIFKAPQFKEYEEDNRTIKEYEEVNRTINLLEGDIFVDFDVQFNDTDKPDEEIMIKPKGLDIFCFFSFISLTRQVPSTSCAQYFYHYLQEHCCTLPP